MESLTIEERLSLLQVLPSQGNLATLRIVRKLREDLSFTEDEVKAFEVQFFATDGGGQRIEWNEEKAQPREYEFGAIARQTIVEALQKLDTDGKVEMQHLDLMDKFGIGE